MNTWCVDIATKKVPRKIVFSFVESATDMCGNSNEKPWQIWSYVVVEFLSEYDFDIKNIKGKEKKLVDALSRRVHELHSTSISMYQ
jgi:hypothetical protein